MAWSDKSVSPVVWTPASGDAANMDVNANLTLADGRLSQNIIPSGASLLLYAGNYSYSTGTWTDISAKANHATASGGLTKPTKTSSPLSVTFSSSVGHGLEIPYAANYGLKMNTDYTVGVRFRSRTGVAYPMVYFRGSGGQAFLACARAGVESLEFGTAWSTAGLATGYTQTDTWRTLICSVSSSDGKIHVYLSDNSEPFTAVSAGTKADSNDVLTLGQLHGNPTSYFNGDIANLFVWPRVLTSDERVQAFIELARSV